MTALFIPSPSQGVWDLGPIPVRAYALCIIAGIIVAIWIGERRWVARGGRYGDISDLAVWAVPFGLVGARAYHVATDHALYFGPGKHPIDALFPWKGGLGIWGAVLLGAVGVYIGCRRHHMRIWPAFDAVIPGVLVAQAMGRWGNYFNQELFGRPTTLPWGLEISPDHRPVGYEQYATFHPTFLYESIWDLLAFVLVIWADRRFRLGHGRVVALYVMAYCAGRVWIEDLRIDPVELNHVLGLRLNVWTSIICFVVAAAYFVWSARRHPGREETVYDDGAPVADGGPASDEAPAGAAAPSSTPATGSAGESGRVTTEE